MTVAPPQRILLVEDDEDDYIITRDLLAAQDRAAFTLDWCSDYEQARDAIRARSHDLYLVDYRLGEHSGLQLVRDAFQGLPIAPVILLTGQGDYLIDLEATALGVTNFLVKRNLDPLTLERSIRYAVRHHQAIRDLRRSEERYALVVRAADEGIWDWDLDGHELYLSPRWSALMGGEEEPRIAGPDAWFGLVHPDDLGALKAAVDEHIAGHTPHLESEYRMRHADGEWRWVRSRGLATWNTDGGASRLAGSLSDITARRTVEERLVHGALHDALTGLPNRTLFTDRLAQVLRRATRDPDLRCAVLFLDVDRFKLVNDSLSHTIGDKLLVALARRIAGVLRPGDTIARLGGDEFTILLDDCGSEEAAFEAAGRVTAALGAPFEIDDYELTVTTSIGVALNEPGMTPGELLRNADIAMYDAKRRGSGRAVFDISMHRRVADRLEMESRLRQAIERRELRVFFQPIVELATGRITGFEALARWPAGGEEVPPSEFIPIAEDSGLIGGLGALVLDTALGALRSWRDAGIVDRDVVVSVNVSPRQLAVPTIIDEVRQALRSHGLPATALRLELTESTLMDDPEHAQFALGQLRALGADVYLDDFGTGYSSLTLLDRFPGEALKLSGGFVATMSRRKESWMIARSIVALGHDLGLHVIAEGIEETAQLDQLSKLGCELGQGYLFARPTAGEAIPALLAAAPWRALFPLVTA
jgi:diguanylate cyclase (GGDEF)-like protein/PAS domain S-box-containing protein